ncbi:ABC transporter ATP-binding protein [Candidatus Micrarchaeota archaeon]|nr:ABC transporter ATP-binding protein [Candidatus Micrarchaeota archaeon]
MSFLEVKNVSKTFEEEGRKYTVLGNISFSVEKDEFIAIVGPSGCGKSILLRILSGIDLPSSGQVLFENEPIETSNPRVATIFQNFALLPWMTVEENVELGLYAQKMPSDKRKITVEKFINIVGLDGVENAYPRELSGGMKQRVGIARALAVDPALIVMDEPFSSLDSLTATNLREELLLLLQDQSLPPDSLVMVTHNIEEAVYMADRIIVLSNPPARIIAQLKISLPRPRDMKSEAFVNDVDKVYSLMT